MRTYYAFCDPSGGSSDSMTMAIAHRSLLGSAVLDGFWERRPPFSPDAVVREFAETLREYRVAKVVGDRYAGAWVSERFRDRGIVYAPSEKTKSEIYAAFVALLNSGRVRFPRDARLRAQFEALERRASRTGKDIVDHLPGTHDDLANCVAGALVLASASARARRGPFIPQVLSVPNEPGRRASWQTGTRAPMGPNDPGPERWWTKLN